MKFRRADQIGIIYRLLKNNLSSIVSQKLRISSCPGPIKDNRVIKRIFETDMLWNDKSNKRFWKRENNPGGLQMFTMVIKWQAEGDNGNVPD